MNLSSLLSASVEQFANRVLALDDSSEAKRKALAGKVLAITPTPFPTLYFVISEQQIDVLSRYEATPQCSLRFALPSALALARSEQIVSLIKQGQLELEGDLELAQQFSQLFLSLQVDISEKLSQRIGDAPAHQLVRLLSQVSNAFLSLKQRAPTYLHEVAQEEWQLLIGQAEYQQWRNEIAALTQQVDALNERIKGLKA